ncbi:hypothetical protein [Pedobacter soli]|uniref:Cold shock protein, CspA family n=1 Tax=Pedobacter soli TaxID=390242 RepID=A0A1G6Y3E5_9SPHI|nr:hypothetical protein [Pedobacter soli]SDD84918.1 hypothetical protein SAMN04488024_108141 [Pedobacter soli]
MGDKRRGEIVEIDFENGLGTIIDENGQDIQFQLDEIPGQVNLNAKVFFDIDLGLSGLVAVKVEYENIKVPG